jgi:hypothetical protein
MTHDRLMLLARPQIVALLQRRIAGTLGGVPLSMWRASIGRRVAHVAEVVRGTAVPPVLATAVQQEGASLQAWGQQHGLTGMLQ